jgi:hypothetical protein
MEKSGMVEHTTKAPDLSEEPSSLRARLSQPYVDAISELVYVTHPGYLYTFIG